MINQRKKVKYGVRVKPYDFEDSQDKIALLRCLFILFKNGVKWRKRPDGKASYFFFLAQFVF